MTITETTTESRFEADQRLAGELKAALPASVRNVTNVTVQTWPSGVVKVRVRVYDEARRGEGQGA